MEIITFLGILIAVTGVIGGQILQGGHPHSLIQVTAFLIVIVGSFGAVLVATPKQDVMRGLRGLLQALNPPRYDFKATSAKLIELANVARREGLLSLEAFTTRRTSDPFLSKCLGLAIDGSQTDVIRDTVETEMAIDEENALAGARFWETWGAICPTIGVLGAVLGLIHVMENIATPAAIGPGIAVAFVATVYGVGFANLFCLPVAFKLKRQEQRERVRKSMVLEGVLGIQSGLAPGALRNRLSVYLSTVEGR